MIDDILKDAEARMQKSIESMRADMGKIRTGRASPALINHLSVDYYGSPTPITQVANISVQDARTLAVQPWEKNMVSVVERAIMEANLGFNPMTTGDLIRIPLPPLTEERRKEMVKIAAGEGENCKVAIRNIRRDANSDFKSLLKDKEIGEDQAKSAEDGVQKLTDKHVTQIDEIVKEKEVDILKV